MCRQLRTESLPIYYAETAFNVDLTDKLDLSVWAGGSTPDIIDTEEAEYRRQTQATTDFYPDTQVTFRSSYEWFVMFVQAFQDSHLHLLRKISITIAAEFTGRSIRNGMWATDLMPGSPSLTGHGGRLDGDGIWYKWTEPSTIHDTCD
ncbi:hypothetical protein LTS18_005526 [Coniosporium uncinatum]|uniref:Uncharacterized protein n=1 Tax=Coniosporium uncinatum TaxID=93489 RepID=A0ACC3D4H5_9PEZI|nr:hypothetical protein LTS18_005526 [Coniosporium uncinatum]